MVISCISPLLAVSRFGVMYTICHGSRLSSGELDVFYFSL